MPHRIPLVLALSMALAGCHRAKPAVDATDAAQPAPQPPPVVRPLAAPKLPDEDEDEAHIAAKHPEWHVRDHKLSHQELLTAVAQDCSYDPGEHIQEVLDGISYTTVKDFNADYYCGPYPYQNCSEDPCDKDSCDAACGEHCETCKASCLPECNTCKSGCATDACRTACASTCLSCRRACVRKSTRCINKTCSAQWDRCMAKGQAECAPYCRKLEDCKPECDEGVDWETCQSECWEKIKGPEKCDDFCMPE